MENPTSKGLRNNGGFVGDSIRLRSRSIKTNHNHVEMHYDRPQGETAGNSVGTVLASGQSLVHVGNNIQNHYHDGSDDKDCLRSLYITDPVSDRSKIISNRGRRTDGTCNWIESTKEYRDWSRTKPALLWICGGPGKGKTFIAIYLSERFERLAEERTDTVALYFFCNNQDEKRRSAANMLRGFILQLIRHQESLAQILLSRWKVQGEALFHGQSFETLWHVFLLMIEDIRCQTVHCIIDGLDECDLDSQRTMLSKVKALFDNKTCQDSASKLKLIILSREHPSFLRESLSPFPHIRLDHAPESRQDVENYISKEAYELASMKNIVNTPLHKRMNDIFKQRSEESFLWVSFVSQDLASKDLIELESSLTQLPQGLKEIYKRIVASIDQSRKVVLREILVWVTLVNTPLSVDQLCDALDIKGTDFLTREQVCLSHINSCGHLLQITTHKKREVVTLVHQSVKDFLLDRECAGQFAVDPKQGHEHITNRMLEYVIDILQSQDKPFKFKIEEASPFLNYAFHNWPLHFNALQDDFDGVTTKHKSLFQKKESEIRRIIHFHYENYGVNSAFRRANWLTNPSGHSLLFMVCNRGLLHLATRLVTKDIRYKLGFRKDLNQIGLLAAACKKGHYEIVKLLVNAGADIPRAWWGDNDALFWALHAKQSDIFFYLSETKKGKELLQGAENGLYLVAAAENGKEDCCRVLIERYNAPVDHKHKKIMSLSYGPLPLVAALRSGHFDLVRKFVREWRARCELDETYIDAILAQSSKAEFLKATDLIFRELKCDINAVGASHILCRAICNSRVPIRKWRGTKLWEKDESISTFISLGADPGRRHEDGGTSLHCVFENEALGSLSYPALKMLIKTGKVDINSRNCLGHTPLHTLIKTMFHGIDKRGGINNFDYLRSDMDEAPPIKLFRWLLDFGANRYLMDNEEHMPIDYAKDMIQKRNKLHPELAQTSRTELFLHEFHSYTTVPVDYSSALCVV